MVKGFYIIQSVVYGSFNWRIIIERAAFAARSSVGWLVGLRFLGVHV